MTRWRRHLAALAGALTLLLVLFGRDTAAIATIWWTSSTFNHCIMIIPIIGWLVWLRCSELAPLTPAVWWPGLGLTALGAVLWILGEAADLGLLRHTALVVMLQSCVIVLLGRQVSRALTFPIAYLLFAIPFGEELVPLLQTLTAKICVFLLSHSSIPAKIDGIFITVPNGFYQVAAACSGVKFLVAMLAYGTLAAHVLFRSTLRRALFMVAAIILPIVANGVRAFGTIYIGYMTDSNFAKSFDHVVYGWFFFAFCMALLMGLSWRFFDRGLGDPWLDQVPPAQKSATPSVQGLLGLVVVALCPLVWDVGVAKAGHIAMDHQIALPEVPGWVRTNVDVTHPWFPRFDGADHRLFGRYKNAAGETVDLSITIYGWQEEGRKIIGYGHGAVDPEGPWRWTSNEPAPANGAAERILGPDKIVRLVESFYVVGGAVSGTAARIKLSTMTAKLTGGDQAATAILVSAPEGPGGGRGAVDHFVHDLGPLDRLAAQEVATARGS